jgi:hypothetical protein
VVGVISTNRDDLSVSLPHQAKDNHTYLSTCFDKVGHGYDMYKED